MNFFPPSVSARVTSVQIGDSVAFSNMFTASDLDGDDITLFRFRDNSAAATSGFFTVRGVRQASNTFIEVGANDLAFVRYQAGLIESSETFSVQVGDGGTELSSVDVAVVNTITGNFFAPTIEVTPGFVQERGILDPQTLFEVSDPEGNPPVRFFFADRNANQNGGHFLFNGVRQESGRFFVVEADELDQLSFVGGRFGQSENVGIQVFDGEFVSDVVNVQVTTLPNLFRPVVNAFNVNSSPGATINVESLVQFSDQDGNAPRVFGFLDTGVGANSGFFTVNGVRQDAGTFFQVQANQLPTVEFQVSQQGSLEEYRVFAGDGRFASEIASATISSVPRPTLEVASSTVIVDDLEQIDFVDIVSQSDNGPPISTYQVLDQNTAANSAQLLLNGQQLEQGVVHTLTAQQFANLQIEGAPSDGRSRDQFLVRGQNPLFFTEWESFDVNTEANVGGALTSGFNWSPQLDNGEKFVITYTFIDGVDSTGGDVTTPPVPSYYADDADERNNPAPFGNAQRAATRQALESLEQFADIDFVEVPYEVDAADASVTFGLRSNFDAMVAANARFPVDGLGLGTEDGDIWFSRELFPETDAGALVEPGSFFYYTLLHEVGHTLGFKHPFEPLNGNNELLPVATDFPRHTVLSNTFNFNEDPVPATFGIYDIIELQRLYRPNEEFNAGNNQYFFSENAENRFLSTINDVGGRDTFNLTSSTANETIDLHEGAFSTVDGLNNSVAIAFGTTIENARGGSGNDTILGNSARNLLFGNEGADILEGDGGIDTLRGGAGRDTYIWRTGDGRDLIDEQTLAGVDAIHIFDDTSLSSLQDDLVFRRFGRDLRIDLRFDQGPAQGSITVRDQQFGGSRIETLRLFTANGDQIGEDIDLNSIFVQADTTATFFRLSDQQTNRGFIAVPV